MAVVLDRVTAKVLAAIRLSAIVAESTRPLSPTWTNMEVQTNFYIKHSINLFF
jgi:hypothetical protein